MLLKEQVLYEKHNFLIRSGFSSTRSIICDDETVNPRTVGTVPGAR